MKILEKIVDIGWSSQLIDLCHVMASLTAFLDRRCRTVTVPG